MSAPRRKVLLVGWDAADWKVIHSLMDAGKMPTVARLVERGTMASLATLHPVLSPMLWTSTGWRGRCSIQLRQWPGFCPGHLRCGSSISNGCRGPVPVRR